MLPGSFSGSAGSAILPPRLARRAMSPPVPLPPMPLPPVVLSPDSERRDDCAAIGLRIEEVRVEVALDDQLASRTQTPQFGGSTKAIAAGRIRDETLVLAADTAGSDLQTAETARCCLPLPAHRQGRRARAPGRALAGPAAKSRWRGSRHCR